MPQRRPIALQRWSIRRVALAARLLVVGVVFAVADTVDVEPPGPRRLEVSATPDCGTGNLMILLAQAVPQATSVPCIATLPAGFKPGRRARVPQRGKASFSLDSDQGGDDVVEVSCSCRPVGVQRCRRGSGGAQ